MMVRGAFGESGTPEARNIEHSGDGPRTFLSAATPERITAQAGSRPARALHVAADRNVRTPLPRPPACPSPQPNLLVFTRKQPPETLPATLRKYFIKLPL